MAVRVRVACVDCGEQMLRVEDLQLFTTPSLFEARFAFTCPTCQSWINRPAWPALVADLRRLRVRETRVAIPREVFEPHRGPALTADEVLDFALELAHMDDVARFACRR